MRWKLRTINSNVTTERDHWIAEGAVARIPGKQFQKRAIEIVRMARSTSNKFFKNEDLSDEVITTAISLSRLDAVFRTRGKYVALIDQPFEPDDIADLRHLVTAIPLDQFRAKEKCFLNPTFGDASRAIGGADADIIVDDLLLDIKVRKDVEISTEDFHQVIGYYLLYEIGGIDGIYYVPHISRVGLYSARYRLLSAWPLKELLTGIASLDEAVQWLSRRLGMDGPEPTQPQRPSRNVRKRRTQH